MRNNILLLMILLSMFFSCQKESEMEWEAPVMEQVGFSFESGNYSNVPLVYRKAEIFHSLQEKAALVIYLHGGSSKGNDNTTQMKESAIDSISNYLTSRKINSVVLVPQCPSDRSWGGAMNEALKALIDEYAFDGTIDTNRIYIMGGSMGGSGTWNMVSSYPNLFAAAMPVAGNPAKCNALQVATTPIFTVMGTADEIMNISTVTDFCNQLRSAGGEVEMETEEGWNHETTCIKSFTTARLDWIFAHYK